MYRAFWLLVLFMILMQAGGGGWAVVVSTPFAQDGRSTVRGSLGFTERAVLALPLLPDSLRELAPRAD